MKRPAWLRSTPLPDKLQAEHTRTGVGYRIRWDGSYLQWEGRINGMSGYVPGYSEQSVMVDLLTLYRRIPDSDKAGSATTKENSSDDQ